MLKRIGFPIVAIFIVSLLVSVFASNQGVKSYDGLPSLMPVTRTIDGSTYTPSATRSCCVVYNIKISCTATIGSSSVGKVLFQYSTNGGSTWTDGAELENSNTVTLAVVLNSVTTQTAQLICEVPPNALCKLTPTVTGTSTITWIRGREKLY